MISLLLTILFSAQLVVIFKVFGQRNIPVFPAIVVNYLTATLSAIVFLPDKTPLVTGSIFTHAWIPFAMFLGSMFISVFSLTSITTLRYGVATASVAMKLGLVFPVLLAFTLYGEPFTWLKFTGILLAFAAVVLSSLKDTGTSAEHHTGLAILPVSVFLGSGACDSLTQFANKKLVSNSGMEEFSLFLFMAAAFWGVVVLAYKLFKGSETISLSVIIGGGILGVFNYFSFLFLLKALAEVNWGSSVVFPVANLATVGVATLAGIIFFKEKLSLLNQLGLLCAAISIALIIYSNF